MAFKTVQETYHEKEMKSKENEWLNEWLMTSQDKQEHFQVESSNEWLPD